MKRILTTALFASLLASTAALADGGIGHNGSYNDQSSIGTSTKTRAEVRAELAAAWRDGTLPSLNRTTYPNLSLEGQTQSERVALREENSGVALTRAGQ
jgi:opacity protein-like surface antigen